MIALMHSIISTKLGQTYLMFCCSSPAGQSFSVFKIQKKKFDKIFFLSIMHPKWKENGDWSAGDSCIPGAKYQV